MDLSRGYKRTDVGVIPESWDVAPFRNILAEFRGGAPLRPSDFTNAGIKVLPKGAVGRTGKLQLDHMKLQYCSEKYAEAHSRNQVDETFTIVVLRDLVPSGPSIGLMVQVGEPETFLLAQGVYGFKVNDRAVPGYLVQLSNTQWYRKLANSIMVGSTQVHITNTAFKRALIPLPPPVEQEAIAEALSDADALIESLEHLVDKKHYIKQGTMHELLTGERRLPSFGEKWVVKTLGDIIERFVGGGTPSRSNPLNWGGDIPWVTVKDFETFNPRHSQESITRLGLLGSASHLIPKGTLITSTRMALGKAVVYEVDVAINQDLKALFPKSALRTDYLYFWFQHHGPLIDELGSGSTVKGISLPDLKKIRFLLPAVPEQTAIATVLSDMDVEIVALETKLEKARRIKLGMMHSLLTGEIRLMERTVRAEVPSVEESACVQDAPKARNRAFEDAVIISDLADRFGNSQYPLGRFRSTKLTYLIHRKVGDDLHDYLKKAAGPYNPKTKYAGAETIAQKKKYIRKQKSGPREGFVADKNVQEAKDYFAKWYPELGTWLEQFHFTTNEQLECLTTVDMAMRDVISQGGTPDLDSVRALIASEPEWRPKLERTAFLDAEIMGAIAKCQELFS